MGEFTDKVRSGKIPGPNKRNFNPAEWELLLKNSKNREDEELAYAGLFFDRLFSHIRNQIKLEHIPINPNDIKLLILGMVSKILWRMHHKYSTTKPTAGKVLVVPSLLQEKILLPIGEAYAPDEIITGIGDGLKLMMRELSRLPAKASNKRISEVTPEDIQKLNDELNWAILYRNTEELWNECVLYGYHLIKHPDGIAHAPSENEKEIARIASIYRRNNLALQDTMYLFEKWKHRWSRQQKEKSCGIPLIKKLIYTDRIERIELGYCDKALSRASMGIISKIWIETGNYESILDEELPMFGLTVKEIINSWLLLQSITMTFFAEIKSETNPPLDLLRFCPKIPKNILVATMAKALNIDQTLAQKVLDVYIFTGDISQELWTQPIIDCGDLYGIVVPCIHAVQLPRIVEGWLRQGGFDLDKKGHQFEKFCKEELEFYLRDSPIKSAIKVLDPSFSFTPLDSPEEEIDLVVIVGATVLLIEAKCILWPDEAFQYANYRKTIENAVNVQLERKYNSVITHKVDFTKQLNDIGITLPQSAKFIRCVLTNSPIYSGFPINNVPVVDLRIVGNFFRNEHITYRIRHKGKTEKESSVKLYKDSQEASDLLESYLLNPPQLNDSKNNIKLREVVFPLKLDTGEKLVHQTFQVELDLDFVRSAVEEPTVPETADKVYRDSIHQTDRP